MSFWSNLKEKALPVKAKPMVFPVGEGLTPEQKVVAQATVTKPPLPIVTPDYPSAERNVKDFWGAIKREVLPREEAVTLPGIFTPTVTTKLPPIVTQTASFGKDVLQGITRQVGSIGTTAGNIPSQFNNKILETVGSKKRFDLPFDQSIPTDDNKASFALFGGKPVNTLQQQVKNVEEITKPYIGESASKFSAVPLVGLGVWMDLSGFGGRSKVALQGEVPEQFLKFLAKKDGATIEKKLLDVGLDADNAKAIAPDLGGAKTVDEVKQVLINYGKTKALPGEVGPIKTPSFWTKQADDVAPQAVVPKPTARPMDELEALRAEASILAEKNPALRGDANLMNSLAYEASKHPTTARYVLEDAAKTMGYLRRGEVVPNFFPKKEEVVKDKFGGEYVIPTKNAQGEPVSDFVKEYNQKFIQDRTLSKQESEELIKKFKVGDEVKITNKKTGEVKVGVIKIIKNEGINDAGQIVPARVIADLDEPYMFGGASSFEFNDITPYKLTANEKALVEKAKAERQPLTFGEANKELAKEAGIATPEAPVEKKVLRDNQPVVGSSSINGVDTSEVVARERYDIPNLKKISFGGSDRDVYDIGNNQVLKVAKTARGFDQNRLEGEIYAPVPKVIEQGKNYVIVERAEKPNAKTKELVKKLAEFKDFNSRTPATDMINKTAEYYFEKGDDEMGSLVQDLNNYDVMINDLTAIRNWGTIDGEPTLLDAGTLNNATIDNFKNVKNLDDADFRDSYYKSREAKKKFRDTDKKTMYKLPAKSEVVFDRTTKEIDQQLEKVFGRKVSFKEVFNPELDLGNPNAVGRAKKDLLLLLKENNSLSDAVAKHEGYHWAKMNMPAEDAQRLSQIERELVKANPKEVARLKELGYKDADIAEEMGANEFAKFYKTGKTFSEKVRVFFQKILNKLKLIFSKRADLIREFSNIKTTITKPGARLPAKKSGKFELVPERKAISEADRLIVEGKIRVVSRDGRDVYQYKKVGQWVNARDESSAVRQVTRVTLPKAKKEIQLPQYLEEKALNIELKKETISQNPALDLIKYYDRKEGGLPEPTITKKQRENPKLKVSEWRKNADRISEEAGFESPQDAREAVDKLVKDKTFLREEIKQFNTEKKKYLAESKKIKSVTSEKVAEKPPLKSVLIDTSTGEGRSIEIQAQKALESVNQEPFVGSSSLPSIIQKTVTPVQQKVHFIDTFLTTPKFVMEKIGFGKEATELRSAMDAYWKELPQNLDKITAWSKEVPKESNKRIFRWLDGEALDLTAKELKVATEIKTWLADWAKRLELPADNQISHYITHIFDEELMAKEFDEDLAKIIADKIPGQVYDPFLEKRLGAKGYKQDTWQALDAYVKRATRKTHMDPVLEKIQTRTGGSLEMSNIEKSQFQYIKRYIDNINLRPSEAEEGIDNFIKSIIGYKWGQRPVTRGLRGLRQLTFRGALGLNPASALRNLSQGANTYAELGEKYTAIGYLKLFKKGAGEELKREGVLNAGFVQDRVLSSTKKALEKTDKVLFALFSTAEKINRGAAYFGAKSKALTERMTEQEAIEYAKDIVRKTQFSFDSVDTPVGMSSDIMKTLSQFQTFTTKQIEFLGGKAKKSFYGKEKAKNIAGLLRYTVAGLVFVYTIGEAFGMKPKELLPWYRFQTPASLKFPVEVTKAVLDTPDKYGQDRDMEQKAKDIAKSTVTLFPAGSQIKKTTEGYKAIKEGGSYDKAGKLQFTQGTSMKEKAQALLFGKYASPEAQNYFNKVEINSKELKKVKPVYNNVQSLVAEGKEDEAQSLVDELTEEEYALYKKYKTAEKTKATLKGKKDIMPTYNEIQSLKDSNPEEAQSLLEEMTDQEYEYYQLVKKDAEKQSKAKDGNKPEYKTGDAQDEQGLIKTVFTYAKAIGVDPATAFNRIFTGQRIRRVDNKAIIVERMSLPASTQVKKDRGATSNMKLDHTMPLQLGGSNDLDNLKLVDNEIWASYTPVENFLGVKLRNKQITKREAQDLIIKFKKGEISAEDILNY